ncbi:MAG: ABC transporter permease [Treponema sp.]|nr:ABC transporter permease [Treponema sp.]
MEFIIPIFKSALSIMIPVFFAAAGGLFPALAGILNIALEGLLLAGAFSSLVVYYFTGNAFSAILCAIITSMSLSALHAFAVFKLKANLFISGLAINLLSGGLCIVLSDKIFKTRGVVVSTGISGLLTSYLIFGLSLLVIYTIILYKTPYGYRLRACEKNSDSLVSLGIKPGFYQVSALIISGFFCGIGGSFLSLNLGAFVPGMSAGKGWIALAIIFLGLRKPLGILAAAFIFALAESFSNHAQGFFNISADFILAFPYICAFIALIIISIFPKNQHKFK